MRQCWEDTRTMAGAQGPRLLPLWLWCWVQLLLAPPGPGPAQAFNLHSAHPTIYAGPSRSYFGFALDFVRGSDGRMSVVVGAPRANTSQPGLLEPGAVYVCPWAPSGSHCSIVEFDPTGDQEERRSLLQLRTYKSAQWFGASVSSWNGLVVACAPLQHWNAFEGTFQATQTPVGTCFVATEGLSHFAEYAPCRSNRMEDDYERMHMSDKRYCEVGFSTAITQTGRLVLGAPGGYYFMGLIYSVNLSAVTSHAPGKTLLRSVGSEQLTQDSRYDPDTYDAYRGYSVAVGEFDGDPNTPEYVVGVPNRRTTLGAVEIFSARNFLQLLQSIQSNQVASYFGHTVAVADVDGMGKQGAGPEPECPHLAQAMPRTRAPGPFPHSSILGTSRGPWQSPLGASPPGAALPRPCQAAAGDRGTGEGAGSLQLRAGPVLWAPHPGRSVAPGAPLWVSAATWCHPPALRPAWAEPGPGVTPAPSTRPGSARGQPGPESAGDGQMDGQSPGRLCGQEHRLGKDDVLVGAPLYMERRSDRKLSEVGQVYLYLQRRGGLAILNPWQTLTGPDVYGRFGTAIAPLGDLDQDGYVDVAVGAPFAGSGRVFIFSGHSEGLRTPAAQVLESPFPGHAAFGFSVRGATDIDVNGYPDVLVGAFGAGQVAVYRARPVVVLSSQLSVPDTLNPEEKNCTAPGSGAPVSCFPIELCVSISGKRLPERVRLAAEVQLDRLKAKSGRRVWELQTYQTTQSLELQLTREVPRICSQLKASLRDEADFKDKLSPIVVSLALSLAVGPGTEELGPVLSGQTVVQEQTRIVVDCGEDNVCDPDLRLAARTPMSQLFLGVEDVVHILAEASNAGEGAFEAELRLQLPRDVHYQRATSNVQGMEKLVCNPKKENETRVVICELGNPMKSGAKVVVDVTLSVSNLEEAGDAIEFQLQLRSKNSRSPHSAVQRVQIPIKAAAELDLRGNSLPATMVLPRGGWEQAEGSRRVEDQGPRVEHVYQLHNQGPGTVSRAELRVAIPSRLQGDILLYLTGLSTEGKINCSSHMRFNHLELQLPTAPPSQNASYQLASRREAAKAEAEAGLATLREPTLVDCSGRACVTVLCQVEALARDQRAMVTIHSVLWMQSVRKRPLDQFIIQSQAWFNVSALPYRIQPDALPSGHATAHTEVMRVSPDAKREIPTRWVVLAVLAGLLLLALFICAMWKMGFFKRTRPPMEEEEELTSDETGEPCTGRGH